MNSLNRRVLAVAALCLVLLALFPAPALAADAGSTIFQRFWDSLVQTATGRLKTEAPVVGQLLQEAEKVFFGYTTDITRHAAVRDVVAGMQYVGLFLLAWCVVLSLSDLATSAMIGGHANFAQWFWRFCVASSMTFGSTEVYSLIIRMFNFMVRNLREFLDQRWTAVDTGSLFAKLVELSGAPIQALLLVAFAAVFLVICIIMWFLIGGVRPAEMTVFTLLAPITWPLYLLPGYEDIPKTAFRGFLGVNALLLLVVGMTRVAVRWVAGGGLADTFWNWIPAISLMGMCVFLPAIVKRILGQGHAGMSAFTTALNLAMGLKVLRAGAAVGAAAGQTVAAPPAVQDVPATPTTPRPHNMAVTGPLAPASFGGAPAPAGVAPAYHRYHEPPVPRLAVARVQFQSAPAGLPAPPARRDMILEEPFRVLDEDTGKWQPWDGSTGAHGLQPRPAKALDQGPSAGYKEE